MFYQIVAEFVGGETEDDFHEGGSPHLLYDTHIPTNIFQVTIQQRFYYDVLMLTL